MLLLFITITLVIVIITQWVISTQRKLVVLEENIGNAMSQIGVQISSRFDVLMVLLDITKGYAKQESETLIAVIKSRRNIITAKSTPDNVNRQEELIAEALAMLTIISERYPDLQGNQNYNRLMDAVDTFANMVCTSRLIYNFSVTKLNSEIRMFPTALIARPLGFKQRDYLGE